MTQPSFEKRSGNGGKACIQCLVCAGNDGGLGSCRGWGEVQLAGSTGRNLLTEDPIPMVLYSKAPGMG